MLTFELGAQNLNFFSISSDGRVTLWTMSKSELQYTDVMELKLTGIANSGGEVELHFLVCGFIAHTHARTHTRARTHTPDLEV